MPACEKQKQNLSFCFWETVYKSEFYETKKQSAEIKKQFPETKKHFTKTKKEKSLSKIQKTCTFATAK